MGLVLPLWSPLPHPVPRHAPVHHLTDRRVSARTPQHHRPAGTQATPAQGLSEPLCVICSAPRPNLPPPRLPQALCPQRPASAPSVQVATAGREDAPGAGSTGPQPGSSEPGRSHRTGSCWPCWARLQSFGEQPEAAAGSTALPVPGRYVHLRSGGPGSESSPGCSLPFRFPWSPAHFPRFPVWK